MWTDLVADDAHITVELTCGVGRSSMPTRSLAAAREDREKAAALDQGRSAQGAFRARTSRQILSERYLEIITYFDFGAFTGPVESNNRYLEHLRGLSMGASGPRPLFLVIALPFQRAPGGSKTDS
ncbi:hypothetical protein ACQREA_16575, partial [Dietzia cinnamea]